MTRWLPHPWFALWLLVAWLLLQRSLAASTVVLGIVLALALSWALGKLDLPRVRVRSPGTLLMLLVRVFGDIIRSNIAVAKIIVSPRPRFTSGFVVIPLEMTHPYALALLACIITATPGTIWVSHDSQQRKLVIHVLDLVDLVLVMTVQPGFGGQAFRTDVLPKIQQIDTWRRERQLSFRLEVDGGVKPENIAEIARAGADTFVAGSAIFGAEDYRATIDRMRSELAKV